MKKIILSAFVLTSLFMTSCKDDTVVDGEGTTETKTCRIATIDDNDGFVTSFTYDGDNLVKMTESDSGEITTYNFVYTGEQLTSINTSDEEWKLAYTDGKVSRVDYYYDTELSEYSNIKYNAEGKVSMIDVFERDGMDDVLYDSYEFTWNGDNLSKSTNSYEEDGQQVTSDINFTSHDDKVNYMSKLPIWLMEHDNFFAYSANNVTAGSLDFLGTPVPISMSYEYDADGKVTKLTFNLLGESLVSDFSYDCK